MATTARLERRTEGKELVGYPNGIRRDRGREVAEVGKGRKRGKGEGGRDRKEMREIGGRREIEECEEKSQGKG